MKYNLDNYLEIAMIVVSTFLASFLTFIILKFNYSLGVSYCNVNNIPLDYILPTSGINFAFGITMLLFIIECSGVFCLVKLLRKISLIDPFDSY